MKQTHVYVIAAHGTGPCKIGISHNPEKRIKEVQTGHPEKLEIWSSWEPEHLTPAEIERRAHKHFDKYRLMGEWFAITVREAEEFIGRSEEDFDGFRWYATHAVVGPLKVFG